MEKKDSDVPEFMNAIYVIIIVLVIRYLYENFFEDKLKKYGRYASVEDLPSDINGIWLSGDVTHVPDGDGFNFFHKPWFSILLPWLWLSDDKYTLSIRLGGIDAPETENPRDGKSSQPFAQKAKKELQNLISGKTVKIKLLRIDRYNRVLAMCSVGWFCSTNVNKKMIELGMACVYEGGNEVDYDNLKKEFLELEAIAKNQKKGMWSQKNYESPGDFKRRHRNN